MVQKNKRGQDLSIGTLILIVLGIIVLVLLILGFSLGWSNLWEKINIFGGGNSLGDAATACGLAVTSQNTFDYCQNFRAIKVDGKTEYVNCQDPRIEPSLSQKLNCDSSANLVKNKCLELARSGNLEDDTKVNNQLCTMQVGCNNIVGSIVLDDENLNCNDSTYIKVTFPLQNSDETQTCCIPPQNTQFNTNPLN